MINETEGAMRQNIEGRSMSRYMSAFPCKCGGWFEDDNKSLTAEEIKKYNCGKGYVCCAAAFKCDKCGHMIVGTLELPEAD